MLKHSRVLIWIVFILAGLLISSSTTGPIIVPVAQTDAWQPVDGPLGGSVAAVVVSPAYATDQTAFAAVRAYGVYRTTDAGRAWLRVTPGEERSGWVIQDLVISPNYAADQTLFVATDIWTYGGNVYRSTDGGNTWQPPDSHPEGMQPGTLRLVISPDFANDDLIYVLTGRGILRSTASFDFLLRSTNRGNTWTPVLDGEVRSLMLSPDFVSDRVAYLISSDNLYRSGDAGLTWQRVTTDLPGPPDVLAFGPTSDLYASVRNGGVYRSPDGGRHWETVGRFPATHLVTALKWRYDGVDNWTLYAGTDAGLWAYQPSEPPSGPWRSSGPYGGHADALALSPDFPHDGIVLAGGWRWGFASSKSGQGLFRSNDGGQTWSRVPQGIADNHEITSLAFSPAFSQDQTAFAGTWHGLYRSRDSGDSWQKLAGGLPTGSPGEITALALSPDFGNDATLLAGSSIYGKLWRSTDGGDTWDEVLSTAVFALVLSPDFPSDGLAFAGSAKLFRSADGGLTWGQLELPNNAFINSLAVSPALTSDATLFAGTREHGVLRSTDYGDTWTPANTGLDNLAITTLALSPTYPDDPSLFAGTAGGLYYSADDGQSWNLTSLPVDHVGAVIPSPGFANDGIVLAGTRNGVYISTDRGMTWRLTKGLTVLPAEDVAASPTYPDDGTLFAATEYGVYKSTDRGHFWTPANRGHTSQANYTMNQVLLSPTYPQDQTLFATRYSRVRPGSALYRSLNGGQNWTQIWSSGSYVTITISPDYARDHTLFGTAGSSTVLRSTDGGENWKLYNKGLKGLTVRAVSFSPNWAHDRTLFAAGDGPTHRSIDGGASWQPLSEHVGPVDDLALSPNYAQDRTLFASFRQSEPSATWPESGVIRSTDGGKTWELVSTGLPNTSDPAAGRIAISPNFATDRTLYVAYRGTGQQGPDTIFRSTDGGNTWTLLPPIPDQPPINALVRTTNPDTIHTATASGVWHRDEVPPGPIPPGPTELVNGRFEEGFYNLKGISIANGWAAYTVSGQPSFAGERFTVHSGQWTYKLSGYAPFTAGLAQVVQVQPGKTYLVTAYYQLYPPGDGQAFLGMQDGTSTTQWVGDSWPGVWRPLSQEITVTSDRLTITLQGSNGLDPNTNVYFDDVTVAPVGSSN